MTIIDEIKNKNPDDVTLGEIREFKLHIEEAIKRLNQLQELYRSLICLRLGVKHKIVIEAVHWNKGSNNIIAPCVGRLFNWNELVNKPAMKMTLEWINSSGI